jgi:hypothetical protein
MRRKNVFMRRGNVQIQLVIFNSVSQLSFGYKHSVDHASRRNEGAFYYKGF